MPNNQKETLSTQIIGNIGLFYVCHELSKTGLNVMTTSRNTAGVDVVALHSTRNNLASIQVKAKSDPYGHRLGAIKDNPEVQDIIKNETGKADFWIMVYFLETEPYKVSAAYIVRGDDSKLITKGSKYWSYNPFTKKNHEEWQKCDCVKNNNWEIIKKYCLANK